MFSLSGSLCAAAALLWQSYTVLACGCGVLMYTSNEQLSLHGIHSFQDCRCAAALQVQRLLEFIATDTPGDIPSELVHHLASVPRRLLS